MQHTQKLLPGGFVSERELGFKEARWAHAVRLAMAYTCRVAVALWRCGARRASTTAAPTDVERAITALETRVIELQGRIELLERRTPARFRTAQYNILSSYLGNNREPWFLFGALSQSGADLERAKQISLRHNAKNDAGTLLFPGAATPPPAGCWPRYVEGILSAEEIRAVEQRDAEVFAWPVRRPKIVKTVLSLDADLVVFTANPVFINLVHDFLTIKKLYI